MSSTSSSATTPTPKSRHIVLGVTGGVAAYKSVLILRQLMDEGYVVSPLMTLDAQHFIGATTLSALASEPVRTSLYGDDVTPSPHTALGQRADLVLVAPATAHFIARLAAGLANDIVTATVLATRAPVVICPAMHTEMWEQPSVQENLATLRRRGVLVMDPVVGHLAGGDEGAGRLPEPADIVALVDHVLQGYRGPLSGKRLLITAGGTSEAIDPVRVVTNRSSGHQGYALAEVAARMGAAVTLVSASDRSFALDVARQVSLTKVTSAAEMAEVVLREAAAADVIIMAAAVSDFTVAPATEKLKKSNGMPTLTWSPTVDILATILERRRSDQIIVGFAAETTDVATNAQTKLAEKPVDILVVNDVSQPGVGFQAPTNAVTLMGPSFDPEVIGITSKEAISERILTRVSAMFERGAQ